MIHSLLADKAPFITALICAGFLSGCATPGLMKRWEREEQRALQSDHFVIFVDEAIPGSVGEAVLNGLEFARERVGKAFNYYSDEPIVCNLYCNERNLRNVCVGLPLGFVLPRRAPLAYVLGGEVHGRLYSTPSGHVSRLWASTFPHEYCHVMFRQITGRDYFQYSWLQEGIGEYFRRLYLQEKVLAPDFEPGLDEHFLLAGNSSAEPLPSDLKLQDQTRGIMSYTDWEVRTALRYDEVPLVRDLNPRTFLGYWKKFNTPKANQVYAISSSLVEFLVNERGWQAMRELLAGLRNNSNLDGVMKEVYGFDQDGLEERWRFYLRKRWPDPWQPNIAMAYLVRGNWEVDGHEAGIRRAMAENDLETAREHWNYFNSRSIDSPSSDEEGYGASFSGRKRGRSQGRNDAGLGAKRKGRLPPAVEHYEAAMAAYSIGRFDEGVKHLSEALEHEPEQIGNLRVHLARGLWLTGEKEKALALYQDELMENRELPFINEVAWCYERAGETGMARKLYRLIAESSDIPGLKKHAQRRLDRLRMGATPLEESDAEEEI